MKLNYESSNAPLGASSPLAPRSKILAPYANRETVSDPQLESRETRASYPGLHTPTQTPTQRGVCGRVGLGQPSHGLTPPQTKDLTPPHTKGGSGFTPLQTKDCLSAQDDATIKCWGRCWQGQLALRGLPTGPNPLHHRDDFSRPALRHGSLNSFFQVALYLPS